METVQAHGKARTFAIGAAFGFVLGAFLMCAVVWQYGNVIGSRAASLQHPARPAAAIDRWDDGTADVDAPILEWAGRPATAVAPGTTAGAAPTAAPTEANPVIGPAPWSPDELAARHLTIPVEGVQPEQLVRTFDDRRSGSRPHEALDILAPMGTPVNAVEDGSIARLFFSKAGGITIYQFDPTEKYCYYYAHLDKYADGLKEGDRVRKGQILGYVGTSGNAAKDTPHLHFAVFRLSAEKHWWEGTPIDPYRVLR